MFSHWNKDTTTSAQDLSFSGNKVLSYLWRLWLKKNNTQYCRVTSEMSGCPAKFILHIRFQKIQTKYLNGYISATRMHRLYLDRQRHHHLYQAKKGIILNLIPKGKVFLSHDWHIQITKPRQPEHRDSSQFKWLCIGWFFSNLCLALQGSQIQNQVFHLQEWRSLIQPGQVLYWSNHRNTHFPSFSWMQKIQQWYRLSLLAV